jgi:glycosyltransferase involved in cell wall biosynthesis
MANGKPRVSIGVPVYNGEKYLRQALDSLLTQTYQDFELIISDNASTDATQQICEEYARKDSRVRYCRSKKNVGGPANYNRVFRLSSSGYFKWAAYDDMHAPEYLQKCVEVLDKDPSVVSCHSRSNCIDEFGKIVGNYDDRTLPKIDSFKPHERFGDLISLRNPCWFLYAVTRADSLRKTPLHGDYILADRNLLAELGLLGRLYEIPEHLFFRRDHPQAYTSTYYSKPEAVHDYRKQSEWWIGKKGKNMTLFPHWKHCAEFFRSVDRVSLSLSEKLLCYREITKWIIREKGYKLMKWDLTNALKLWRMMLNED